MRSAALLVLLAAATAHAAPGALATPPAGWRADPEQASAVAKHGDSAAEVYVPDQPGIALTVTRTTATSWSGTLDQAARAAVDELHASAKRGALTGGTPKETAWDARADGAGKQVLATLAWTDAASHAGSSVRLVVVTDGTKLVAVTGECYATDDVDPALVTACKTALATIDPGIAVDKRAPIGLAAEPAPAAPSAPDRPQMQLSDGSKTGFPPITISQSPTETDRRPMYIGGGLVVLAAAFWWNRRRRDRFDEETESIGGGDPAGSAGGAGGKAPRGEEREDAGEPAKPPGDDDDDDSDDLHAAARGKNEDAP